MVRLLKDVEHSWRSYGTELVRYIVVVTRSLAVRTALSMIFVCGLRCFGSVLTTFPVPTTLENITVSDSGNIFTSALNSGTVYDVTPSGTSQIFGQADGSALGLSFYNGSLYTVSATSVYRFGNQGGTAALVANVAGAKQLNGWRF